MSLHNFDVPLPVEDDSFACWRCKSCLRLYGTKMDRCVFCGCDDFKETDVLGSMHAPHYPTIQFTVIEETIPVVDSACLCKDGIKATKL